MQPIGRLIGGKKHFQVFCTQKNSPIIRITGSNLDSLGLFGVGYGLLQFPISILCFHVFCLSLAGTNFVMLYQCDSY